ncbi:hypothetical protein PMAYCL1PPCAC_09370, partial [Pristionchus mayeri]
SRLCFRELLYKTFPPRANRQCMSCHCESGFLAMPFIRLTLTSNSRTTPLARYTSSRKLSHRPLGRSTCPSLPLLPWRISALIPSLT